MRHLFDRVLAGHGKWLNVRLFGVVAGSELFGLHQFPCCGAIFSGNTTGFLTWSLGWYGLSIY